jgi:ketosteroid isomerase-like protein
MSEGSTTPDLTELVRRFYQAMNRRDVDAVLKLLSPDFAYRPIPTFADSQERRGAEEFRRFLDESHDTWADDAKWHIDTVRAHGNALIALLRFSGHARASGIGTVGGIFEVLRFRDGPITRMEDFTDREDALTAAEERG